MLAKRKNTVTLDRFLFLWYNIHRCKIGKFGEIDKVEGPTKQAEVIAIKILILSCNTGEGHNAAARAVQEYAVRAGHDAEIVDYLNFFNAKINSLICDTYIGVVRHAPGAFGAFYRLCTLASRLMPGNAHSVLYHGSAAAAKKLWKYLNENHTDAVVCTHMLAGEAISWLRKHGYSTPFSLGIATDYTCYPFWREASCDYYVVPHADIAEKCVKRGIPREQLLAYGIPVSRRFSDLPDRSAARAVLGLPRELPLYLIMGGSMGAGKLKAFTKKLHPEIGQGMMIVICGKNRSLKEALEKQFAGQENVQIVGFTTDVPLYMAACDCLYTKPGGLTSTETLVAGAPVVHTKPIPGCESDNFKFFAEKGLSIPAKGIREQLSCGIALANDPEKRAEMRKNQAIHALPDAADRILAAIEEKVQQKEPIEA